MTHITPNPEKHIGSTWRRFFNSGGWWKAFVVVAVYYGIYQLLGLLVGATFPSDGSVRGAKGSPMDVFITTGLPILLGCIVLVIFALSLGWLKELFARQAVRGRRWMWVAVGVVLAINLSAALSTDYQQLGGALVTSWLITGLFVGFAEEVLTRGFAINLMRKAGHGEVSVALVSSGLFAAMHFGNLFTSDQGLSTTLLQVVYTFAFGLCMYLALRVTGSLVWPILLHATTDPTLFLHADAPLSNVFTIVASLSTFIVIGTGFILLIALIVSERRMTRKTLSGLTKSHHVSDPA